VSRENNEGNNVPRHLEGMVPGADRIVRALSKQTYTYEVDRVVVRAVDNEKYVATASPHKPHRFGPPLELVGADGLLPFTWIYIALDERVAVWESQLVKNKRGAGNGFYITCEAADRGKIARIRFSRRLILWNLGEEHSSRLGIHDIVSFHDHEACQWLGCHLRAAMLSLPPQGCPDGFVYPSRRVPGQPALAIADWAATALFDEASVVTEPFSDSAIHTTLLADTMLTELPERDAPPPRTR
jgi:hypothetical protein